MRPHSYTVENVGRVFKHSKKKISWSVQVRNDVYDVAIFWSRYTSKLRIFVNQEKKVEALHYGKYLSKYQVSIGTVPVTVVQANAWDFDILVNQKSMLQTLRQTPAAVKGEENSDTQPTKPETQSKAPVPCQDLLGIE